MNEQTQTEFSIHPATTIGHVSLTVASLENQTAFYQQAIGFHLHWRAENKAGLGAGCAGRHPEIPIKYIVDGEGPPESFVTCHEPRALDNDPSISHRSGGTTSTRPIW